MKIAVRAFADGKLLFEEHIEDEGLSDSDVEALVAKHMLRVLPHERHMLEIEFLDEPDSNQRFFRFGTDPNGMVLPIAIDLRDVRERK